jgi:pimeloyl-ACP methyl ester carboxylesterase
MPTVEVDPVHQISLNYQCLGEGEDLVLIHGLGANLAFWYPGIASALAEHYRVMIYDLRGHGRSTISDSGYTLTQMVKDLRVLLEYLEVEKAHFVGHSFGARVALLYGICHSQQVKSLTVADTQLQCLQPKMRLRDWPYWQSWRQELLAQGATLPSEDQIIDFHLLNQLNKTVNELSKPSLKNRDMGRKGKERWQKLMETAAKKEFEQEIEITAPKLSQIVQPTLAIYGAKSHCLPTCGQLKNLLPNCSEVIIEGVGHFFPVIKPDEFVQAILNFCQKDNRCLDRKLLVSPALEKEQ